VATLEHIIESLENFKIKCFKALADWRRRTEETNSIHGATGQTLGGKSKGRFKPQKEYGIEKESKKEMESYAACGVSKH